MRIRVSDGGLTSNSVTATGTVIVLRNFNVPEAQVGQAQVVDIQLLETTTLSTTVTTLRALDRDRIVSAMLLTFLVKSQN